MKNHEETVTIDAAKRAVSERPRTAQQVYRKTTAGEPMDAGEEKHEHTHVISVVVENSLGAFNRVSNLFSARGFNLHSVAVGATHDPKLSRMTIVTSGNDRIIGQVVNQLGKLIDTREVVDLTDLPYVERELCLIRVRYTRETRAELMDVIDIFRGKVVNITPTHITIELTGPTKKINAFVGLMSPMGIDEVARSGCIAMHRELAYESVTDGN